MDTPQFIQIETSSMCAGRCWFCPLPTADRKPTTMPDLLYEKIIQETQSDGMTYRLFLLNDPLTDPQIANRVRFAKRAKKTRVELHSNGAALSADLAIALVDSQVDTIRFSVDGIWEETLSETRKLPKKLIYGNIERFIEINKANGLPVRIEIRMIRQLGSDEENREFHDYWSKRTEFVIFTDLYELPPHKISRPLAMPCPKPQKEMFIRVNGDVLLCCWDWQGVSVSGNVALEHTLSLWNRLASRREALRRGQRAQFHPCAQCAAYSQEIHSGAPVYGKGHDDEYP